MDEALKLPEVSVLDGGGRKVRVDLGERSYEVVIEAGGLDRMGAQTEVLGEVSRFVIVTNPTVAALYSARLRDALLAGSNGSVPVSLVEIPDGEKFKTLATLEGIYDHVLDLQADRKTVLVPLGGGIVGDVGGFAGATILRGIRVAMVPTTLLAQVDSSVGGKTGVNRPNGKNLVGAFHQPCVVVADPSTLATLSDREYRAGLAEVVKYAMILDAPFFELLDSNVEALAARDPELLTEVVTRCVALKAAVVAADEHEGGLRRILNFGHTIGHAIEQVTGYRRFLHGESVAIGMVAATQLSAKMGACGPEIVDQLADLLDRLGLENTIPDDLSMEALVSAVASDKKAQREHVTFIVAEGIGSCREQNLPPAEIVGAVYPDGRSK